MNPTNDPQNIDFAPFLWYNKSLSITTYYANRNSQKVKKLKHFSEPIHILSLVFHQGVNVAFERDGRIFVSENFG